MAALHVDDRDDNDHDKPFRRSGHTHTDAEEDAELLGLQARFNVLVFPFLRVLNSSRLPCWESPGC